VSRSTEWTFEAELVVFDILRVSRCGGQSDPIIIEADERDNLDI